MLKRSLVIIFFIFISVINVNAQDFGDILILNGTGCLLTNVKYVVTPKSGKQITGFSDDKGWIKFKTPLTGKYKLYLDFSDYDGEVIESDFEELSKMLEFLVEKNKFQILQLEIDQKINVDLNGKEKYIFVFQTRMHSISMEKEKGISYD